MTMLQPRGLWTSAITSVLAVVVMGLTGRAAAAENRVAEPVAQRTAVSGEQAGGSASSQADKRIKREYGFYEPEPLDFDDHEGYVPIFKVERLRLIKTILPLDSLVGLRTCGASSLLTGDSG